MLPAAALKKEKVPKGKLSSHTHKKLLKEFKRLTQFCQAEAVLRGEQYLRTLLLNTCSTVIMVLNSENC